MPATGYTHIDPGDTLTAASLTSRMDGMEAAINDLPLASVEPHSLTRQHLPSVIVGTPGTAELNGSMVPIGTEAVFSSQVGAEPYPGWNTVAGWKVVNDIGTAAGANTLTVASLNVTLSTTVGIEVMAEIEIVDTTYWNFGGAALAAAAARSFRSLAVFAIQYSNDAVTWYHIPRTESYVHGETADDASNATGTVRQSIVQQGKRMTIWTLIRSTDAGGAITVNYVRLVCSCHALGSANAVRLRTRQGRISAQGIQFGTLT